MAMNHSARAAWYRASGITTGITRAMALAPASDELEALWRQAFHEENEAWEAYYATWNETEKANA